MKDEPKPGVYESLITQELLEKIERIKGVSKSKLNPGEVSDRVALHIGKLIVQSLNGVSERRRVSDALNLAQEIVLLLDSAIEGSDILGDRPSDADEYLSAILPLDPSGEVSKLKRPLTPLLDTTLLTNSPSEPRIGAQILSEINSADRIDIIMAFVRKSGIRPLLDDLKQHVEKSGGRTNLRVLTTTYTGSTERAALDALADLGAKVRVSYDLSTTRLHAKAWLFHRESGFPTAYVGSSNLTHSAQVDGLEWNFRLSGVRNPDAIRKMESIFEAYWNGGDFRDYDPQEFDYHTEHNASSSRLELPPIELRLEPFQERLLERIQVARLRGCHKNLLVSATGTGKTVMAAVDYAHLRGQMKSDRLLFVAHRKEILEQSRTTFRIALRDPSFGELWVGGQRPERFDHVFASIQSLTASDVTRIDASRFDVVIVDEFHHAGAATYETLLDHLKPVELLGLTATPERADGVSILKWFEEGITAELRLWDAIDQHRLVPFCYWGINDGMDFRRVPWRRGRGYDIQQVSNLFTSNDAWARFVIQATLDKVNLQTTKALGFCVSVEHAKFMTHHFNLAKIPASYLSGSSSPVERERELDRLRAGELAILFSVDLFNEGIDIPSVNTILFLRPTDSATLFLQQLGRGLRKDHGKSICHVLDFVGRHTQEFRFDTRFRALIGGSRRWIEEQVKNDFPFLPAGCQIVFDKIAKEEVLRSIKEALPNRWGQKVDALRLLASDLSEVTLESYLFETGLDLSEVYSGGRCFSDLKEAAGLNVHDPGDYESTLRRAIGRVLHIDDDERLGSYLELVSQNSLPDIEQASTYEKRLLRMLIASIFDKVLTREASLEEGLRHLWSHPQILSELKEVFALLRMRIDHLHHEVTEQVNLPLRIHGRYTRIEILAAFGIGNVDSALVQPWREGAYHAQAARSDLLAFTLDKSKGNFSPTTSYRDYAISRELIHWESQSGTRVSSPTGQRYINHVRNNSSIMLFARKSSDERAFWFLGPATYVSHHSERPISITWRLKHKLPGDLYSEFSAAVA